MPAPRRHQSGSKLIAGQVKAWHAIALTPRRASALAAIAVTVTRATEAAAARLELDDQPQDFPALLDLLAPRSRPVARSG